MVQWISKHVVWATFLLASWIFAMPEVVAQDVLSMSTCVARGSDSQSRRVSDSMEIAESYAEDVVTDVARSIVLSRQVKVVACTSLGLKVSAYHSDGTVKDVPPGEYIIYNPEWVREVMGNDETQIVFNFGHELGHILNNDFLRNATKKQKELEADRFGGCAVARLGGSWDSVESLLQRVRTQHSIDYGNREEAVSAARKGFESCEPRLGGQTYLDCITQAHATGDRKGILDCVDQHD